MACGTESHRVAAMNNKGKWASTIIQRIYIAWCRRLVHHNGVNWDAVHAGMESIKRKSGNDTFNYLFGRQL
jgi:hypothetical protein